MLQKALLDIDLQIADLREQVAAGKATLAGLEKLDALIEDRIKLMNAMPSQTSRKDRPKSGIEFNGVD